MKAETFFYLITRGRHTGLPRNHEVWFAELDGVFYLLAEATETPDWVSNIAIEPKVSFTIGNRKNRSSEATQTLGLARLVDEASEVDLCARVRGLLYAKYRWNAGHLIEVGPLADP
jgi:hypothetical protein